MINKKIKCIFVTISLAVFTGFTGCGKEDGGKNGTSKAVYETIHSEGASFDIRVKDKGEDYYYNPSTQKSYIYSVSPFFGEERERPILLGEIPSDKPCILNSLCGYSLVYDSHYVYDYEKNIIPITSLTTINTPNELYDTIISVGGAVERGFITGFNAFKLSSANNIISFNKIDKGNYIQIEAEVTFITHVDSINNNGDVLFHGYIILTESDECQNMFFFGGLEGEFTKDEMEHIKNSFVLDDSKFALSEEDFKIEEDSIDIGGKKITGSFPIMFRFKECDSDEMIGGGSNTYVLNINEYHKVYDGIWVYSLDGENYTSKDILDTLSFSYGGWEDGGDFVSQDGKVFKKGIIKESYSKRSYNQIFYICVDGNTAIEFYFLDDKHNVFSEVIPAFEKALSTVTITDGESDRPNETLWVNPDGL